MQKIFAIAEWIRLKYQSIIITAVSIGLVLGVWSTTAGQFLQQYSQILTFLMIFFISLTITPKQFSAIKLQPLAVMSGLILNFAFMPLICWALAKIFINDADLAVGIILVGVVPCAGMAAVWTALLKADVPLSMAINALTMVLAPFLIPPLMVLLAGSNIGLDPWKMFQQLAFILLIPLVLGVFIRWWAEKHWNVKPYLPLLPASSALLAVFLMFAICNVNTPLIIQNWEQTPPLIAALVLVFLLGFLVPFWIARKTKWQTRIAVTYSSGMKNLPIAVGLVFAGFPIITGLPVALAMIVQMLMASLLYRYLVGKTHQVT